MPFGVGMSEGRQMRVLIFGAGAFGKGLYKWIAKNGLYEVVGFIDNSKDKTKLFGLDVYRPSEIKNIEYDEIIISNERTEQRDEIIKQLECMGIAKRVKSLRDDDALYAEVAHEVCVYGENDPRIKWISSFSRYVSKMKMNGSVAECGVYKGDCARYINKYFPDRTLYLFDTFDGFDERDIEKERDLNGAGFLKGEFNHENYFNEGATYQILRAKLPSFEKCVIKKGYFPETAKGVDDEFVFVNLDMDLYQPMLAGLNFFYGKMVRGGVILLHDYYSTDFTGVADAVDDFQKENGAKLCFPIGDGCSIALIKE